MKVLVYGNRGWIGKQFVEILQKNNVDFVCGTSRVDDETDTKREIILHKPTHVIAFIGRTHGSGYGTIDYLEQPGKLVENVRDNLYAPFVLANICTQQRIHYTYIGTGCIFEYDKDHHFGVEEDGFNEYSKPNFFGSSYSVVKGFTDRMMHHYEDYVLNLRIRLPVSATDSPRNLISKLIRYNKICSIPNSITVLPVMLPYILDMMNQRLTGTINFTNPGLISHNEILELYKQHVDPSFTWENFNIEDQDLIMHAKRSNNFLDTTTIECLYPELLNAKKAVELVTKNWNKKVSIINNKDEQNQVRNNRS